MFGHYTAPLSSCPSYIPPALRIYEDDKEDDDGDDFLNENPQNPSTIREIDDPAPYIIVVQGPPKVGKSLLIECLVRYFTMEQSPYTVSIPGKQRRLQFVECPNDIDGMIDAAKYADVALLLIDASYQYHEMETFEFMNLLRMHSFPKVMGVITHLDEFRGGQKDQKEVKECLEESVWSEICKGITVFHLSGLKDELYKLQEIRVLAEALSDIRSLPSSWRGTQPYVLVDRLEDLTPLENVQKDKQCDRNISLYGYLRGCNIKNGAKVHIAGVGDFSLAYVTSSVDPFHWSSSTNAMETVDSAAEIQEQMNIDEINGPVELNRSEIEGFRTGTYLRMEVLAVPFQMVENFDPCHPILVGGISLEEEIVGYMQVRLRRHNWHMRLLKTGDPITVSSGWRRYQTKPIYAIENDNGQHQILKYIPQNKHCLAVFWAPYAPPHTRIAVVQGNKVLFRIAAEAVVLDSEHDAKIMKEHKWKGTPVRISKETALIKFTSDIDIAKFEGAPVRTVSGISGQVDKVGKSGAIAECTFESRICKDDNVIMPELCQVEAPCFFNSPLTVDRSVPVDKDSLEKDDPHQRRLGRRGVLIIQRKHTINLMANVVVYNLNIKSNNKQKKIKKKKADVVAMSGRKRRREEYESNQQKKIKKRKAGVAMQSNNKKKKIKKKKADVVAMSGRKRCREEYDSNQMECDI